jgi:hypothetical protein
MLWVDWTRGEKGGRIKSLGGSSGGYGLSSEGCRKEHSPSRYISVKHPTQYSPHYGSSKKTCVTLSFVSDGLSQFRN